MTWIFWEPFPKFNDKHLEFSKLQTYQLIGYCISYIDRDIVGKGTNALDYELFIAFQKSITTILPSLGYKLGIKSSKSNII